MSFWNAIKFKDENDLPYGIKHVQNKPRVSAMPYTYDIAEGNVPGHTAWHKIGFNLAVVATERDICPFLTNTSTPKNSYVFPTTTSTMTIVSSDANDKAAGSGARTVNVYYLDEAFVAKSVSTTLTGLTTATIAVDMYRIQNVRIATCGVSNSTIGNLTVASGGNTYGYVSAGRTRARQAVWTVPTNTTLYINQITYSTGKQAAGQYIRFTFRANYDEKSNLVLQRGLMMPFSEIVLNNTSFTLDLEQPLRLPQTTDLKVSAISSSSDSADVTCVLRGWTE